jgi:hypothetical protein
MDQSRLSSEMVHGVFAAMWALMEDKGVPECLRQHPSSSHLRERTVAASASVSSGKERDEILKRS